MNPFEFPEFIERYSADHTTDPDPALNRLCRQTHLKTVHPQMLSGKIVGQFLSFISKMITPQRILEIGTFTGYSAYCLSQGLTSSGMITTIEVNEEQEEMILEFFEEAGILQKTNLIIGDALEVLPGINDRFDLIFIDGNKEDYPLYFKLCMEKLKFGGYMLADNVLWGGKAAVNPPPDLSSEKIHQFNELVKNHPQLESVFLTIRDGVLVARKIDR